jgi:hypothetical protein
MSSVPWSISPRKGYFRLGTFTGRSKGEKDRGLASLAGSGAGAGGSLRDGGLGARCARGTGPRPGRRFATGGSTRAGRADVAQWLA